MIFLRPVQLRVAARDSLIDYSYEAREKFRVVAVLRSTNRLQTRAGSKRSSHGGVTHMKEEASGVTRELDTNDSGSAIA
jgi:hypothetical protein